MGIYLRAYFSECRRLHGGRACPLEILAVTQSIEREMGRLHKSADGVYSDRVIDIDLLLYGNLVLDSPVLTLPHPLMQERLFVMAPLVEIAPEVVHPVLGKSMREIYSSAFAP